MVDLNQITQSKHIVLITDNETFSLANVLYSYILTLHKKVSLISNENIAKKFAFLPWFDKVRSQVPGSSDLEIKVDLQTLKLFQEIQLSEVKINQKMATAFYSSFLIEDELHSILCNNEKLTVLGELILLGADVTECYKALRMSKSLALFRLKAVMFANFGLQDEATVAEVYVDDTSLKQSGASIEDAIVIAKELLEIAHVNKVVLVKQDENKILKEIKEEN
ncbi:hypothetical protein [Sulfurimonas sp. C5]|uniref:hypothetical protein n=1 Tax=Sulfurimonas sp. C5 TaxID=3036947 RepID=UPI002457F505|nr:hypothetical protein [Sulfurimonas sp. C5]MDH4945356.1 hypothetical protein [Sulfurimonas sp. C5]